MMIVLHLSPEIEAKLRQQAVSAGKLPEELALNAIEEQLEIESPKLEDESPQEWIAGFRRWAESHCRLPIEADDSRESIYAGRGE